MFCMFLIIKCSNKTVIFIHIYIEILFIVVSFLYDINYLNISNLLIYTVIQMIDLQIKNWFLNLFNLYRKVSYTRSLTRNEEGKDKPRKWFRRTCRASSPSHNVLHFQP